MPLQDFERNQKLQRIRRTVRPSRDFTRTIQLKLRILPILIGGLLYSIGAIFYALKRPGKNAKYFGFHELFHIFVLAAWISQYLAICFAIYRSR